MDNKKWGLQARGKDWVTSPKDGTIQAVLYDTKEEAEAHAQRINQTNTKYRFKILIEAKEYDR